MKTESKNPPWAGPAPEIPGSSAAAAGSETFRQELAEQKDLYLHLAADFENFKRRSRQESAARALAQKESFIVELLPVVDNLERAMTAGGLRDDSPFHQGVAMTLKQLQQLLLQHGIESEEILGQPFDPHQCEALSQGHDLTQPDHSVLSVIQRGYQRGGQVLRPAKVVVNDLGSIPPSRHGR